MSKRNTYPTKEDLEGILKEIKYRKYYARWPQADPPKWSKYGLDLRHLPDSEYFHIAWTQFSKILNNGKGMDTILTIQNQIKSEIQEIQINLDEFPEDADDIYKTRLKRNSKLLHIRERVIERLITEFSVHGEIEKEPDFELNSIQNISLDIVCKGSRTAHKREVLEEYLRLSKEDPSRITKDIFLLLEGNYGLESSTFYDWVKKLNEQIERITLSELF